MRLVQFTNSLGERRVGAVAADGELRLTTREHTVYDLAQAAISSGISLDEVVSGQLGDEREDYDAIVAERRILPPLDHPEPARFLITGTGLTHLGSADARDRMHDLAHGPEAEMTDSMKIFRMGLDGGKPLEGEIGVQPEWFFKGVGTCVVPPEAPLPLPSFALAGGEEAEIVGLYLIGPDGTPWRLGFAIGNEFSDQVTEAQNYLYLAHSKLRACSFGPEMLVGTLPQNVEGRIQILRDGASIWQGEFLSGEANMSHSIRNLEHYHFRYEMFRRPGDLHAYFFGAAILSCANGVTTTTGDVFEINVPVFGRALRNSMVASEPVTVSVRQL